MALGRYQIIVPTPTNRGLGKGYGIVTLDPECFTLKEYPDCDGCERKYIPKLGCLWCNSYSKVQRGHLYKPRKTVWKKVPRLKKPFARKKTIKRKRYMSPYLHQHVLAN